MHFSWEILVWKSKFWNTFFGARTQGGSSIFDQWPDYLFFGWKLNFFPLHIITHIFGRARLQGREAARCFQFPSKKEKFKLLSGLEKWFLLHQKSFFCFFPKNDFVNVVRIPGFDVVVIGFARNTFSKDFLHSDHVVVTFFATKIVLEVGGSKINCSKSIE